jgi:hypothetical protein
MKENHILSSGSAGYLTVSIIGDLEWWTHGQYLF